MNEVRTSAGSNELQYIADFALKTRLKNEGEAFDFAAAASAEDIAVLKLVADRMLSQGHHEVLMRWMDQFDITDWQLSLWMYFLLHAMDVKRFKFD